MKGKPISFDESLPKLKHAIVITKTNFYKMLSKIDLRQVNNNSEQCGNEDF